ncbi:MAG: hypothetical protein LBS36_05580 [Oscillospiraceae bacterium]|jgi:acyl carrier protein|nr:hypothetical protein [Oscillospiraceae bacterium]
MEKLRFKSNISEGDQIIFCGPYGRGRASILNLFQDYLAKNNLEVSLIKRPSSTARSFENVQVNTRREDYDDYLSLSLMASMAVSSNVIKDKILEFIGEVSELEDIDANGFWLKEDFGLDDWTLTQLIVLTEEYFEIKFDLFLLDCERLKTLDDICHIAEITIERQ